MERLKLGVVGAAAVAAVALVGCMTFETTLPGTLDMRKELAKSQSEPLEPTRPAFGDTDDSFHDGFILTESTDAPTKGEYITPKTGGEGLQTPAAPDNATIYRRVMRQWFIIYLFPILADPDLVTTDLKAELAQPGTKASSIRITSGIDIVDFGRYVIGFIIGPLNLVPTRTTEVIAYVEKPADKPAAAPPPAATTAPETPATPAAPDSTAPAAGGDATTSPPPADSPNLPDAPVTSGGTGGGNE